MKCPQRTKSISSVRVLERGLIGTMTVVADPAEAFALPKGIDLVEKDRPILLAAIVAHATHLLTGDKDHFGKYFGQAVAGVLILRPRDYLSSRSQAS